MYILVVKFKFCLPVPPGYPCWVTGLAGTGMGWPLRPLGRPGNFATNNCTSCRHFHQAVSTRQYGTLPLTAWSGNLSVRDVPDAGGVLKFVLCLCSTLYGHCLLPTPIS